MVASGTTASWTTSSRFRTRSRARSLRSCARHRSPIVAQPATNRHTDNVQAYGLYLRGRYSWNKRTADDVYEGIKYFEQAIALDPKYALAYTGLADSYSLHIDYRNVPVHEGHQKAKFYAEKAIELDDTLAEAHASLAWSHFVYDWDWDEAGTRVPARDRARSAVRAGTSVVRVHAGVAGKIRRSAARGRIPRRRTTPRRSR